MRFLILGICVIAVWKMLSKYLWANAVMLNALMVDTVTAPLWFVGVYLICKGVKAMYRKYKPREV